MNSPDAKYHSLDPPSVVIRLLLLKHIQDLLQGLNEERRKYEEKGGSGLMDRDKEIDQVLRDIYSLIPITYQ